MANGGIMADVLPVIDPYSLNPAQIAGRRCAVPNCRRLLVYRMTCQIGRLPGGRPVLACGDCAPEVRYECTQRSA